MHQCCAAPGSCSLAQTPQQPLGGWRGWLKLPQGHAMDQSLPACTGEAWHFQWQHDSAWHSRPAKGAGLRTLASLRLGLPAHDQDSANKRPSVRNSCQQRPAITTGGVSLAAAAAHVDFPLFGSLLKVQQDAACGLPVLCGRRCTGCLGDQGGGGRRLVLPVRRQLLHALHVKTQNGQHIYALIQVALLQVVCEDIPARSARVARNNSMHAYASHM